jgi:hypothetical protein
VVFYSVRKLIGCATLVCLMFAGLGECVSASSADTDDSSEKVWEAHTEAQRQLQRQLADFLITRRPDLKESVLLNRDLQLALIDRRSLEFRYLLAQHPEQIVKSQGISKFVNFTWTEANTDALLRTSPQYEPLRKRVEQLRNDAAPQGSALREAQQALANDAELQQIYNRFEQQEQAAQKLLKINQMK